AITAAALFLVHPLQVEPVAWASAFPYVLSLTALLLALLAYVNGRLIASIALYGASLLARANAIAFPIVLLLLDVYPLQRRRRTSPGRLAAEKVPFAVLAAAAAIAESRAREIASVQEVGVGARLTMAATAPFRYLGRIVWPSRLSARRSRTPAVALAMLALVAAAGTIAFRQTAYWRDSIALWARAADVDRRDDVATYNLAIALAEAGREDEAIGRYEETLRLVPDHDLARKNLAILKATQAEREGDRLAQAGRFEEAGDRYADAIALDGRRLHAHAARGMLLARRGRLREAADDLRQAFDGGVTDVEVPNTLAFALAQTGDSAQAAAVLTRAAAAQPDNINLKHNLARLLATSDDPRVRDGARALDLALEVNRRTGDRDPRALDTLAAAYAVVGRFDEAR